MPIRVRAPLQVLLALLLTLLPSCKKPQPPLAVQATATLKGSSIQIEIRTRPLISVQIQNKKKTYRERHVFSDAQGLARYEVGTLGLEEGVQEFELRAEDGPQQASVTVSTEFFLPPTLALPAIQPSRHGRDGVVTVQLSPRQSAQPFVEKNGKVEIEFEVLPQSKLQIDDQVVESGAGKRVIVGLDLRPQLLDIPVDAAFANPTADRPISELPYTVSRPHGEPLKGTLAISISRHQLANLASNLLVDAVERGQPLTPAAPKARTSLIYVGAGTFRPLLVGSASKPADVALLARGTGLAPRTDKKGCGPYAEYSFQHTGSYVPHLLIDVEVSVYEQSGKRLLSKVVRAPNKPCPKTLFVEDKKPGEIREYPDRETLSKELGRLLKR